MFLERQIKFNIRTQIIILAILDSAGDPARTLMAGTVLGGRPIFCGGRLATEDARDCRIYNPDTRYWDFLANMSMPRFHFDLIKLSEDSFWAVGEKIKGSECTS